MNGTFTSYIHITCEHVMPLMVTWVSTAVLSTNPPFGCSFEFFNFLFDFSLFQSMHASAPDLLSNKIKL